MKPLNTYHRKVCGWLSDFGISYIEEYKVGQYSVDIYLPDSKMGVEIDGPQHDKIKDMLRDGEIERETGMMIIRIKVGTSKARCLGAIFGKDYTNTR